MVPQLGSDTFRSSDLMCLIRREKHRRCLRRPMGGDPPPAAGVIASTGTGMPTCAVQPALGSTTVRTHYWPLSDAITGAITTAADITSGDLPLHVWQSPHPVGGVTWHTGDQFTPDALFNGTSGAEAVQIDQPRASNRDAPAATRARQRDRVAAEQVGEVAAQHGVACGSEWTPSRSTDLRVVP